MFDKLKKLFNGEVEQPKQEAPQKAEKRKKAAKKATQPEPQLTPKELATQQGEPYVSIVSVDVDPNNINAGSFELDWNDKFVINLVKAGYKQRPDDTDQIIVDRWFQTVCRNIALEVYEQSVADPANRDADDLRRVQSRNIGNGRSEVS